MGDLEGGVEVVDKEKKRFGLTELRWTRFGQTPRNDLWHPDEGKLITYVCLRLHFIIFVARCGPFSIDSH